MSLMDHDLVDALYLITQVTFCGALFRLACAQGFFLLALVVVALFCKVATEVFW